MLKSPPKMLNSTFKNLTFGCYILGLIRFNWWSFSTISCRDSFIGVEVLMPEKNWHDMDIFGGIVFNANSDYLGSDYIAFFIFLINDTFFKFPKSYSPFLEVKWYEQFFFNLIDIEWGTDFIHLVFFLWH